MMRISAAPAQKLPKEQSAAINITKPFLPPLEEYEHYLYGIWERNWLTNDGPLVIELENRIRALFDLPHAAYVGNGTIALQLAIRALGLKDEIITTPFSFVATASSIVWEGCVPVMVDILPTTLTIDPERIEAAITPRTTAILATHVYGNACEIGAIANIAARHKLKVIYDAAHAFGASYKGKSLFAYGDIATTSFHATKLFHTIEGGAIFTADADLHKKIGEIRNFGYLSATEYSGVGINGKNSEFHAAMGLCNLKHFPDILRTRELLCTHYTKHLGGLPITVPQATEYCTPNYAYYTVIFQSEDALLRVTDHLNRHQIFPRRYFYPSLSQLNYISSQTRLPVCEDISRRILCLPLYHTLTQEDVIRISNLIAEAL